MHFGEEDFLERYKKYEAHLAEWRAQYPKLSSVDMRYERQAVLEMQPGSSVPVAPAAPSADRVIRRTGADCCSGCDLLRGEGVLWLLRRIRLRRRAR